jgi:integrase
MAARPRGQDGWVAAIGKNWVGFWYEYQDGKRTARRQRVVSAKKGMTQATAARELRKWLDATVNTTQVLPIKPTLGDIWAVYERRYGQRSLGHARTMRSAWRLHLAPALGSRLVEQITEHDIEALFASSQLGSSGKDKIRVILRALLDYAVREGALKTSPMHRAVLRFDSTTDTRTLDVAGVRAIRNQLAGVDLLMFDVLISTGMSQHEFLALRPDDIGEAIRIDEKVYEGKVGQTKTARRRDDVACPPDVLRRLVVYAAGRSAVAGQRCFLWPALRGDGPMNPDRFTDTLQAAAAAAGVAQHVDWLILRRTWATLSGKNQNVVATAAQLRNNPATTQKHYMKGEMDSKQMAVNAVWDEIAGQGKGRVM